MNKEALIIRRGGGTSLNFKIVGGTTQPTSPKENTIWVNTSTTISGWVFSSTEPESPMEGIVWFKTGAASGGAFNALKKNGLMIYVIGSAQYIDGAWVSKTAEIYQSGEWKLFVTYFFKNGSMGLGGGVVINSGNASDLTVSNLITMTCPQYAERSWRSAEPINVSGFKTMRIKSYIGWGGSNANMSCYIGLATEAQLATRNAFTVSTVVPQGSTSDYETSIDLSGVEGEYYVVTWFYSNIGSGTHYLDTYYVEFEA